MSCKYLYNGEWLTEDQLHLVYQQQTQPTILNEDIVFYPAQFTTVAYDKGIKSWIVKVEPEAQIGGETQFEKDGWTYTYSPWMEEDEEEGIPDKRWSRWKIVDGKPKSESITEKQYNEAKGLENDDPYSVKPITFKEAKEYWERYKKSQADRKEFPSGGYLQQSVDNEGTVTQKIVAPSGREITKRVYGDVKASPYMSGKTEVTILGSRLVDDSMMVFPETSKEDYYRKVAKEIPELGQYITRVDIEEAQKGIMFQKNENAVNATLKIIDALNKSPRNSYPSNQINGFFNDLRKYGASDVQINMLREYIARNNIKEINKQELIAGFMAEMSYTVEINTAKTNIDSAEVDNELDSLYVPELRETYYFSHKDGWFKEDRNQDRIIATKEELKTIEGFKTKNATQNSSHYSNLTVSGGTNYTENEIRTPDITPSIKGHAAFATDKGIGWFRSDEERLDSKVSGERGDFIVIDEDGDDHSNTFDTLEEAQAYANKNGGVAQPAISGSSVQVQSKTRRILEIQSDLFQKARRNFVIDINQYALNDVNKNDTFYEKLVGSSPPVRISKEEFEKAFDDWLDKVQNPFLSLLQRDNNWVGFFVKSIIQDSAKKGYENVLFPSGNTANKVEGQTTLEEFIKEKEKRLARLEKLFGDYNKLDVREEKDDKGKFFRLYADNAAVSGSWLTEDDAEQYAIRAANELHPEMSQIKDEIKNAKEGKNKFAAINAFYETTIKNILDKRGYKPERIKDEHGNEWYKVGISPERDLGTFYFQKPQLQSSKASPKTIAKVKEWLKRVGIDVRALDLDRWKGVNGVSNLLRNLIEIAEGKENVALPEEAMHFAIDMIKHNNPKLYRKMFNKIGQYAIYQKTRALYIDSVEYRNPDGSLNIPKIKEEAMGKLLAEYFIQKEEMSTEKPELLLQTKTWWEEFVDWIKSLLNIAKSDPFEEAVENIPEYSEKRSARVKELAELIQMQDVPFHMRDAIDFNFRQENYRDIVANVAEQLADSTTYEDTRDSYLGGDDALAQEILSVYQTMLQIDEENSIPNQFADGLEKKLDEQITKFALRKIVDDKAIQEDDRNYYEANIEGTPKRIGRTTEWAKKKNIQNTGGRDYFADLDPKDKAYYAHQATSGISGHFDIERIIKSALNPDGTVMSKEKVRLNFKPMMSEPIFRALQEFLLGNDEQTGFLYQFEEGTKFRIEQQILNDKVSTTNDNGEKVKGRAGTIDLLVLEPISEKWPKGMATIYDWKFMGTKSENPQYQHAKQKQHQLQLGDYKRTLKEGYGLKEDQMRAFTIPISAKTLDVEIPATKEMVPVVYEVEIGDVNFKTEDRPYLLPVAPEGQSTGNKEVDSLLSSLNAKYRRIYKKKVGSDEYFDKKEQLNKLSDAIRSLHIALNFEPLSLDAINFKENIKKLVEKYKNYDSKGKTIEEMSPVLQELADAVNSAAYYADVDEVFSSEYGDEDLSEDQKKTLASLQKSSSAAKTESKKILGIINKIVEQKAIEEGVVNILLPQKEAKSMINKVLNSSAVPVKSVQFVTKIAMDARSADQIEVHNIMEEFGEIYGRLTKVSSAKGVSPLALIADKDEHALIRRVDRAVFDDIKKAKIDKNIKGIYDKIDVNKYKALLAEKIAEKHKQIDERVDSTDPTRDAILKRNAKELVTRTLDLSSEKFIGWKNGQFASLISKSIREEEFYSKEYKELLKPGNEAALDMYKFIVKMNQEAKEVGYLGRSQGDRFLAFINATLVQRVSASSNKFGETWNSMRDMFTIQKDEEQTYGKKDEETGELDRSIPTYFTYSPSREVVGEKAYKEFIQTKSKDLLSIVSLTIKSLVHFKTSKKLESLFQSTLLMERYKGHLETDAGKVIFEGDDPKVYGAGSIGGNSVNSRFLMDYLDDELYGINLQADDLLARVAPGMSLSAKKIVQTANRWVQQIAVGLKLAVAIPNYVGSNLQALINTGHFYSWPEYIKNHGKIIASAIGIQADIDKGLIDLVVALNDENFAKDLRGIAWKQSPRKWLSTLSWQDFMMSTNRIPDVSHELTNALTWMQNTMVVDGKLENIRQYLRKSPEFEKKYREAVAGGRSVKEAEREFEEKVEELKKTKALPAIAKFDEKDMLTIPGFDIKTGNLAQYRAKIIKYGRSITAQMSREDKGAYNRDIIAKSFMMFKNWIVTQVELRGLDIHKNATLDEWEYGRVRLFVKTWRTLGFRNILKMRHLIKATPEGIEIMRKMYEEKLEDYYRKTGEKLEITEEEFFDMIRKELRSEAKELTTLLTIMSLVFAIKAAAPPDDEEDEHVKNRWKFISRLYQKSADELKFYYSPLSAESMTRGTILPSLSILSRVFKLVEHTGKEVFGDEETKKGAHPLKYLYNLAPVASQFQNEIAPIVFPEWAKEQGIRVSEQARAFR